MDSKNLWLINEALRVRKLPKSRVAMVFNLAMSLGKLKVVVHITIIC
jgi:hypothetical protein